MTGFDPRRVHLNQPVKYTGGVNRVIGMPQKTVYKDDETMPPRTKPTGQSPGETDAPSSTDSVEYAEKGAKIKARYGKQPQAPAPTPAEATPPAPAKQTKFRFMPNVAMFYTKWSPEWINDAIKQSYNASGGNLERAYHDVGQQVARDRVAATRADGVRPDQVNIRDISATFIKLAKDRQQALAPKDVPGGVLTPADLQKMREVEDDIATKESARLTAQLRTAHKTMFGKDLPEEVEDDPPKPKAVEMPAEEIVGGSADAAPSPKGKTQHAEAKSPPYVGFGDVREADRQADAPKTLSMKSPAEEEDDLGAKLRAGAKAWNAEQLATEDVGE